MCLSSRSATVHLQSVSSIRQAVDKWYGCETLIPDTLYSVTMHIGFRIEPRVSLYLRQVVEDLVADGKVDLRSAYPSLRKNGIFGDFRFIIIHRVYYPESSDNRQQNLLMSIYALISKIGIDEPKALGLDTSMVVVERVRHKGKADRGQL